MSRWVIPCPVTATSDVISSESGPACLVNARPTVTSTVTAPAEQVVVDGGVRVQVPSNGPATGSCAVTGEVESSPQTMAGKASLLTVTGSGVTGGPGRHRR